MEKHIGEYIPLRKADGSVLNLDLFTAQDSMTSPVKTVNIFASVHSIAKLLLGNLHNVSFMNIAF